MNARPTAPTPLDSEILSLRSRIAALEAELAAQTRRADALDGAAAEAALARDDTRALLDTMLAIIPTGIAIFDAELRFVRVNPFLAAVDNRPTKIYPGQLPDNIQPNLARLLRPLLREVLDSGVPIVDLDIHGFVPSAPTAARDWVASFYPVNRTDGQRAGVVVVVREETERLRAERAIRERDEQLLLVLEAAGLGTWRNDMTLRTITLDERARAHFGLSAETVDDAQLQACIHPADIERITRALQATLSSDPDGRLSEELRVLHPDGSERWLALHARTYFTGAGAERRPTVATGITQDITARKEDEATRRRHSEALSQANAELARALRLKDEFLAMMSHELRTPLNAVLGLTEAMDEGAYGPVNDRQRQTLAQVARSGRHLLGILSDILDLTRIEAGTISLEQEPVEVESLCRSALQLVAGRANEKNIRLLRTVAYGVDGLRADERRLTQILANLLDNAVKFTPAGGTVGLEVAADPAQEQITFTIWDTGIGIDPADLDRLFQPFTQVDGRLARSYEGIGLGLTLVRRLTDLHGGSVRLESTPGVGSRFTVVLPWSDADNSTPTPQIAALKPSWQHPPHVVLADDDEITLSLYAELLTRLGCVVMTARTGTEALAHVCALRPSLAVLDVQMPELDGLTVMRRIRATPDIAATPIIAVTALAMPGDRERCLAAGATRYLAKPVSGRTLIATIVEVLAAHGAT